MLSFLISLAACAVLFIVPIVFVWNDVYEDGFFGRIGLIGISFSSMVFGLKIIERGYVWPESEILLVSFAIFLMWHLCRFHRRVLTTRKAERHEIERRRAEQVHGG